ncbi:hypothetical protein K504DRAFT_406732 [Pleomassaria siparia CBS 279.74]|uniref:FHA domain-containing protein n=1 Tax=Pleomassaria siparia CBS 279.74 TaxID=1314801 RepID=A0A6G1K9L4_9PLEO|nr:hypothetical protein K504DRAFT_406732 [Pleomassaria siparia CBS 279.74]
MWFIEHENLSGGKREWIKPGSQRLYGRTRPGNKDAHATEKHVFLDNKTISRKHMVLKVLDVPPEDGTKLHLRSQLEITDLSCRQGTTIEGVDGSRTLKSTKEADGTITNDTMIVTGTECTIRLSANYPPFKITWQPVVFTYAAKESKESKARSASLHALDIKTSTEYVYNKTTHVVSVKRNLPKVLQGLVGGSHIVTSEYLDAIITVATNFDNELDSYAPSKLEEDFDKWWPREAEYITPAGNEPVGRSADMLVPAPARAEVFKGLTFIFLNETQHNTLHGVIAGGGGKALFYQIEFGKTTMEEYVEFVRNTAGEKKRSEAGNGRLPVVTVRLGVFPEGMEDWASDFVLGVDQMLNQRSIPQNEFLDAIIVCDASSLLKPATEVVEASSSVRRTEPAMLEPTTTLQLDLPSQTSDDVSIVKEESARPAPKKRRRGLATSRFTGFDDYEPPPKTRKIEETQPSMPMEDVQKSVPVQESHASSQPQFAPATQRTRRREPSVESVQDADNMAELFPAATAVRNRRAATRAASASVEPEAQPATRKPRNKTVELVEKRLQAKRKAADKEINVAERLRARVKEEEERMRADAENLREQLEGVDISEMRNLAMVEEMELIPRTNKPQHRTEASSDRWNDEWNGRKNFKKFRRRGAERSIQIQKVIVPFEEAPQRKGFGVGDSLFISMDNTQTSLGSERRRNNNKNKGRNQEESSEEEGGFVRPQKSADVEIIIPDSDSDDDAVVMRGTTSQRSRGTVDRVAETQTHIADSQTQTQKGTKRSAPVIVAAAQPASKRTRTLRRDDSSDEEETGFRFRRRK